MTPGTLRRIFVVGVPRSGTTLVQSLLAAHGELTSFTESHYFSRHFRRVPFSSSAVLVRHPAPRLRELLAENPVDSPAVTQALEERIRRTLPPAILSPLKTRAAARLLADVLDELTLARGRSGWIEKTPRHLRYLPFLTRLVDPPPHFVHVIRDGLETVASLHTASRNWQRHYDLDACVRRWNADLRFSLKRLKAARRRGTTHEHLVVYEQLTSQPESTLEQLCARLGLPWDPRILERYTSRELVTPDEPWKAGVDRKIRPSATSLHTLTEAQRDRVRRGLRTELYDQLVRLAPRETASVQGTEVEAAPPRIDGET